ncbi:unnamed protein product [Somion occarium]|uniref:SCP domain-containing protein n=1 Tax=Somion occarium TaxID=3059160 RepID=A0ABP1D3E0_9APHY
MFEALVSFPLFLVSAVTQTYALPSSRALPPIEESRCLGFPSAIEDIGTFTLNASDVARLALAVPGFNASNQDIAELAVFTPGLANPLPAFSLRNGSFVVTGSEFVGNAISSAAGQPLLFRRVDNVDDVGEGDFCAVPSEDPEDESFDLAFNGNADLFSLCSPNVATPDAPQHSIVVYNASSGHEDIYHIASCRGTRLSITPAQNIATRSSASSADVQQYLSAHNVVRAQHGAQPLTWSDAAADKAQTWANGCVFQHSGGRLGPYGENLAAGTGDSYGIHEAVKSWTDEVSEYDPNDPQPSHFTQVVWKGTDQVGCAVQSCNNIFPPEYGTAKYFVCEYFSQGNVIGQFPENVQT